MNKPSLHRESSSDRIVIRSDDRFVQFGRTITMPIVLGIAINSPFSYSGQNQSVNPSTPCCITHFHDDDFRFNRIIHGIREQNRISARLQSVTPAPIWLVKRMEALQQMPSPTLWEVETSFRASEEMRSKSEGNPRSFSNGQGKRVT